MQLSWQVNIRVSQIKSGSLITLKEHESSLSLKTIFNRETKKKVWFLQQKSSCAIFFLKERWKGEQKRSLKVKKNKETQEYMPCWTIIIEVSITLTPSSCKILTWIQNPFLAMLMLNSK